ncbi:MAG: TonB-dependent receptor plug domain-containing protein, partial [Bacteroidota bacterium]
MKKLYHLLAFLASSVSLNAQIHIQGIVISSDNQKPLESVRVQVKNSDLFVVTDKAGHYALSLAPKGSFDVTSSTQIPVEWQQKPVLIFSLNGFLSIEKEVKKSGQLDVELPILDLSNAGELVDLKMATTSIGVLGGHQVLQPYTGASLNGKIAGLQTFGAMNAPGEDVLFQLRSANTLSNSQQPLIVLDGVWLSNMNLSDIHPEDIAHVEVLKGAASTALYGSRGGNGVIKITTRRGADLSTGQSRVTFQSEYGFSQPDNQYNLNTKTNREIVNNSGPQPVLGAPNVGNTFTNDLPALKDYQTDLLLQNGAFQSNYLAVENQAGNTNFLASVHRLEDVGVLKFSDGYVRNALRFNLDHQLNKKWQFCAAAAYTFSNDDIAERGENSLLANTLSLTPIFDLEVPNEEDGSLYDWDIDNTGNGIINPLYWQSNVSQTLNTTRLLGNWTAKYQMTDALQFRYTALLDRATQAQERFVEKGFLSSVVPNGFTEQTTFGVNGS